MKNILLDLLARCIPSKVILNNCIELIQREQVGIRKYGVTLDDAPLTHEQILQHLLEEQLDAANYTRTALMRASLAHLDYTLLRGEVEALLRKLDRLNYSRYDDGEGDCGRAYDYAIQDAEEEIKLMLLAFDSAKVQRDLRR